MNCKKKEILENHKPWYSESDNYWHAKLPGGHDGKQKNCRSKTKEGIEQKIVEVWYRYIYENQDDNFTVGKLYSEHIDMYKTTVKPQTVTRAILLVRKQIVRRTDNSDPENPKYIGYFVEKNTKTQKGKRWVPLTDEALKILDMVKEMNERYGNHYSDENGTYIFVRHDHIVTPEAVKAQLVNGCNDVGIPVRRIHRCRKTFASELLAGGIPTAAISSILGHEDVSTTYKYYIRPTESDDELFGAVRDVLADTKA